MLTERCVACGTDVPLSAAVHMLVNPKDDDGVVDGYLCGPCFEDHLAPILPEEDPAGDADGGSDDGPADDEVAGDLSEA